MDPTPQFVPVALPNGATVHVEVTPTAAGLESAGGYDAGRFAGVIAAIEGVGLAVQAGLAKVAPSKASVELGLEIGVEAGQLTALLVKGTGKANWCPTPRKNPTMCWPRSKAPARRTLRSPCTSTAGRSRPRPHSAGSWPPNPVPVRRIARPNRK